MCFVIDWLQYLQTNSYVHIHIIKYILITKYWKRKIQIKRQLLRCNAKLMNPYIGKVLNSPSIELILGHNKLLTLFYVFRSHSKV